MLRDAGGRDQAGADPSRRPDSSPVSGIRELSWFALGDARAPECIRGPLRKRIVFP
jgi:hypothetical protein